MNETFKRLLRASALIRRAWVVARLRLLARLKGATFEIHVDPSVRFGRGLRVWIAAGTRNRLVMGPACRIGENVYFVFRGGEVLLGKAVSVLRGSVLDVSGTFTCLGHNILSYHTVVHCSRAITLDLYASTNEFVSLVDGVHHHTGEHEFFHHNTTSKPIEIGRNAWIANKASVLPGVRVGNNSVVAPHSLVNRDVPDGKVAAGVPARVVAPRLVEGPALRFFDDTELPWDPRLIPREARPSR